MAENSLNDHDTGIAAILFNIEPLSNVEINCIDAVIASLTMWLHRHYELMYANAWNFSFTKPSSSMIGEGLRVKSSLDVDALEHFHGVRSIIYSTDVSTEALELIKQTLQEPTPVMLTMNSFWVPWDENYQKLHAVHSFIIVGIDAATGGFYCTDPYFKQKGILLPLSEFHKGFVRCSTFQIVGDEILDFEQIIEFLIMGIRTEIAGNRPFIQMRELSDALTTSFQPMQETAGYEHFSEMPLFANLADVADGRIKFAHLLRYLGTTYDPCFLAVSEKFKKISSQWGMIRGTLLKMHLTSRWSDVVLQKISLRILNVSIEEQALAQELLAVLSKFQRQGAEEIDDLLAEIDEADGFSEHDAYMEPRSEIERQLVAIWQEVLEVPRIGILDTFFALGGQSIKALNILMRMQRQLQMEVPINILFQYPTIQELAQYLSSKQTILYNAIKIAPVQDYYPLTSAQERMYFLQELVGAVVSYNIPGAFIIEGELERECYEHALYGLI